MAVPITNFVGLSAIKVNLSQTDMGFISMTLVIHKHQLLD